MSDLGLDVQIPDSGCCGMAGSFGFERGDKYDVSVAAGERVLLPAVRAADPDTVIVADVNDFPGHISCDARSRSEIVVPVFGRQGELIAVLDVDSEDLAAFGDEDRRGLEEIVQWFRTAAAN